MEKPSGLRVYDPDELRRHWERERDLAVLLVDETKVPIPAANQTFVVFSGVLASSGAVCDLMTDLLRIRASLPEIERDRSFKSSDLWWRAPGSDEWKIVPEFEVYVGRIAAFYKETGKIHCAATTDQHLTGCSARITIRKGGDRRIQNEAVLTRLHSAPFVTWLKHIARSESFGRGALCVVVDGSHDLALTPGTCFNLSDLNRRPDGSSTKILCETAFDIFVGSDDHAPFRDALIAPDFLGNFILRKIGGKAPGYREAEHAVLDDGQPLHAWEYDLAALLDVMK